jgi:hypothetical protein
VHQIDAGAERLLLGAALEAPAPFGTLVSLEWGYGLQGIDASGRRGTHVVRLSGYKVF